MNKKFNTKQVSITKENGKYLQTITVSTIFLQDKCSAKLGTYYTLGVKFKRNYE